MSLWIDKQKKSEKKFEFNRMIDLDTAQINRGGSQQEAARKKTKTKYDSRIAELLRGLEVLKDIPIGEMLYVRASSYRKELDLVVTPEIINLDSIRCILWAQEKRTWLTERIVDGTRGTESKLAIKFTDIKTWKRWTPDDAAFTINHEYQTPAYKRLAYGTDFDGSYLPPD